MDESESVIAHYGASSAKARVTDSLRQAGFGDGPLSWEDLIPLDQFHVRGFAATRDLASALHLTPDATVLDIGCGPGGASRFLAATYGVHVTAIDLSPSFIEIAVMLTERAGLTSKIAYRVADALDLPFEDSAFDYAWTQHVAMNIRDRPRLYGEIHRVLKPGGSLAIYDIVLGNGGPLIYPVPWARDPTISFLLTSDAMREVLVASGFDVVSWIDTTDTAAAWFAKQQSTRSGKPALSSIALDPRMQADFAVMVGNLRRNLTEGRIRLVQTILRRA